VTSHVGLVACRLARPSCVSGCETRPAGRERIAALQAPAGLDLGAETAEEVAISILAELVRSAAGGPRSWRPRPATIAGRDAGAPAADGRPAPIVDDIVLVDPVCGMTVDRKDARHLAEYGGVVYAFCQMVCRTRFIHDPASFVAAASAPASFAPASSAPASVSSGRIPE
jgi:xanthine dehydrogenase accessory factor